MTLVAVGYRVGTGSTGKPVSRGNSRGKTGITGDVSIVILGAGATLADKSRAGLAAQACLLYTSPSPRDLSTSRMPSSA